MRTRTRGYAILAAFLSTTVGCTAVLQAQPFIDPAIGSYTAVTNTGSTRVDFPLITKKSSGWFSSIAVQNLGASQSNTTISFYSDSPTPDHVETVQIPVGAPQVIMTSDLSGLADGFIGSVVVESSQPVAGVVYNTDGIRCTAYSGFAAGASTLHLPQAYCDGGFGFGITSTLAIQNVGGSPANVNVSYTDGKNSNFVVDPDQSLFLDQESQTHTCPSFFSATVTADQDIASVMRNLEVFNTGAWAYEGQRGASNTVVAPGTFKQYRGIDSTQIIQNVSTGSSTVNVSYEGFEGSAEDINLDPDEVFFDFSNPNLPTDYRGAMTATSNRTVVSLVEIFRFDIVSGDVIASSAAATPDNQASTIFAPFTPRNSQLAGPGLQMTSTLQIDNTDTTPTNVTIIFYDAQGNIVTPPVEASGVRPQAPFSLDAGESTEIELSAIASADLPSGPYAAKIESDGETLAASVMLSVEWVGLFIDGFESGDTSSWSSTVQ